MKRISHEVAEVVSAAWHKNRGGNRIEIPVGIIASLALVRRKSGAPDIAEQWVTMTDEQFVANIRKLWLGLWVVDPYLAEVADPIHRWAHEDLSADTLYAARKVVQSAVQADLFDLTTSSDPSLRAEEDLLGRVLTQLRSPASGRGLGEMHSPTDVAAAMARLLLDNPSDLPPRLMFSDDTAGTGGLLRVVAQQLRRVGEDPSDFGWYMGEVDPLACACAATNAIIWGLGPNVLVWCGDVLEHDDGPRRASDHRLQAWLRHREVMETLRLIHATRQAEELLEPRLGNDASSSS